MIQLPRFTQMAFFSIRAQRYRDNMVLLKAKKIGSHNKVIFTHSKSMGNLPYYISGATVKKYGKKEQLATLAGGSLEVYAVPIDCLEVLELVNDYREVM